MVSVSYVYPNVSEIAQRGGLLKRWQLAEKLGCDYIEIPADFIKNKTEMKKTGLNLGDSLTEEAIVKLYQKDSSVPKELKYILHTEPSLIRHDRYGMSYQAPLKWHNREWQEKFVAMTISISNFFSMPATVIEIHPGYRRNSFQDIAMSTRLLLDRYREEFKVEPLILIENRTGQFISSGKEILYFWKFLSKKYPHLRRKMGIALDIQQLYTVTKKNFLKELEAIPLEALKGFHIHYKHRVPSPSNDIPWRPVFSKIANIKNNAIINPEIHHRNRVNNAIEFCQRMLQG